MTSRGTTVDLLHTCAQADRVSQVPGDREYADEERDQPVRLAGGEAVPHGPRDPRHDKPRHVRRALISSSLCFCTTVLLTLTCPVPHFHMEMEIMFSFLFRRAYQNNDISEFERVLKTHRQAIMEDPFIREHIEGTSLLFLTQLFVPFLKHIAFT